MRYLRSLSFIQGTAVNLLRTSIMFLMLYLIYTRAITVGQFFSLFIYSFFIFGPLQELGNIINIYRETEVSLKNFEDILQIPKEPQPANPVPLPRPAHARVRARQLQAPVGVVAGAAPTSRSRSARGDTIAFVGPSGAGKTTLVKLLVGLYPPQSGDILYNGIPAPTIDLDQLRERIGFVTQDTQLFSGTIRENLLFVNPTATDAECLDVLRKAACDSLLARADRGLDTRHRRRRRQGVGRREAAAVDRAGAAAASAPARLRRGDLVARLADRRGDQRDHPRRGGEPRRHHDPDRAPALDDHARRPHLTCSSAAASSRSGAHDAAARSEGAVLRDVAAADWRAPRRRGRRSACTRRRGSRESER